MHGYIGITHSDEMMYIFSMPAVMEGKQRDTEKRMCLAWTNFATYGDPTPNDVDNWLDDLPKWESFRYGEPHYMRISDEWKLLDEYSDR